MAQKILVVDDDLFIRELYTEILQKDGYEVEVAVDGEEGLDKIRNNTYSLVLLDMNMPKLDGIGVLTTLGDDPKPSKNPIILLTNSGDDKEVEEGLKKGAQSYFVKADMTPNQLLENIKKFITA